MHLLLLAGAEYKLDNDIMQYTLENSDASRHFSTVLLMVLYMGSAPLGLSDRIDGLVQFKHQHEHESNMETLEKLRVIEEFIVW